MLGYDNRAIYRVLITFLCFSLVAAFYWLFDILGYLLLSQSVADFIYIPPRRVHR